VESSDAAPLRIVWAVSKLSWQGGIGRVVEGATRELAARGHSVCVAGPRGAELPAPVAGVEVVPWKRRRLKLLDVGPLHAIARDRAVDILHFHSALPHGEVIAGLRALRGRGLPALIVSAHTGNRASYPKRRARLGLRAADRVVLPSEWSAQRARAAGADPARTRVVYAGIRVPPESSPTLREPVVLALGKLSKNKGMDVAIDAFAACAAAHPDWCLEIAGDGPERVALEAQAARSGCAERIRFLGWVGDEPKAAALERASIGLVPSRVESFGGVLLELQAAGLPCVASDTGGMSELIQGGSTARAAEPGRAEDVARELEVLLTSSAEREDLGARAREFAAGFTWSRAAQAYEAVYREVLEERGAR
jgi:glycosyltransferase involved in cell wall biosynthesis